MIDLHTHTTASDGSLTPKDLLQMAANQSLQALAITDHDTVDGITGLLKSDFPKSMRFIPGIEISASAPESFSFPGSFHVLGYFIDPFNKKLAESLTFIKRAREERNPKIIERLNDLGFKISYDDVKYEAGEGQIGRPHMARVLINKGYVADFNEAFDSYLGKGKPAFVDKARVSCEAAAEMINSAGGVTVLAHPMYLGDLNKVRNDELEKLLPVLKKLGFGGIEVYYSDHTQEHMEYYTALADRFDLVKTGGSDFHGSSKKEIRLGSGRGNLNVPYEVYENLKEAAGII